ncbi:MAG: SUMF1/EgtB/PvdO family nonheme iron enzyme [Pseudomonadota bacterium]
MIGAGDAKVTVRCTDGMVFIPTAKGSENSDSDERPVGRTEVSGFCMERHKVTNSEYSAYEKKNKVPVPRITEKGSDGPRQPVVFVGWQDARNYCAWKYPGGRLPTKAECKQMARGKSGMGDFGIASDQLNDGEVQYNADIMAKARTHGKNSLGLYDMAGKVGEWTNGSSLLRLVGTLYENASIQEENPERTSREREREVVVVYGGSWFSHANNPPFVGLHPVNYSLVDSDKRDRNIGFRCVVPLQPATEPTVGELPDSRE